MPLNKSFGFAFAGVALILCGAALVSTQQSDFSRVNGIARRLGGRAYVDGSWSQQSGAEIKGGVEINWKKPSKVEVGPRSSTSGWKSLKSDIVQILPGNAITKMPNNDQMEAQIQWIGAIIRTAKQGGVLANKALDMIAEREMREKNIGKHIVAGAVSGAATGAAGGPKGAAIGAALGGMGGAIVGATGGWGRRKLQWGGSHAYTDPSTGRSMNSGGYLVNPRRSDQIRANNAGALTRSEAQRMGLPFRRKEEASATFEKDLIAEVVEYAENAIKKSRKYLGDKRIGVNAANVIKLFSDDIAAASAAQRLLAVSKSKVGVNDATFLDLNWSKLIEAKDASIREKNFSHMHILHTFPHGGRPCPHTTAC